MKDIAIYEKQSFGQKLGFGRKTALLIIDFQVGFTSADVLGGFNINQAIDNTAKLLNAARKAGLPIGHVRFATANNGRDVGTFGDKVPALKTITEESPEAQFVESVMPLPTEYVSVKRHSSAFFGTNFAAWLAYEGVDTLLITGCTTSGCVRASTVDASAHGLRPLVVTDCVGDRAEEPHHASLFDMGQKYADLITLDEVLKEIA
ncbi:MAG: isochorismatase family protein [Burkholderiaceae bacterium]|nr:isochorismatase family protein [Burkholderiaceae bacterium]MCD8517181.1 isochorismatase family protein [Burkholderiaceae bacterium]MCD8536447.1 isochorismatase family protein [Burkholderiaceae bacterium]MCD8565273.1 isochorismatase family protein [Burkholderiaceae bacterium]